MSQNPDGAIHREKVEKLKTIIANMEVDAVILTNHVDMYYFSGTTHGSMLLAWPDRDPLLVCRRVPVRAESECVWETRPINSLGELVGWLPANFGKIGFVCEVIPAGFLMMICEKIGLPLENVVDISMPLRFLKMVKNEWEIGKIRKAGDIVSAAYSGFGDRIEPGMTEFDIAVEFEYLMRKNGHLGRNRFRDTIHPIEILSHVLCGENMYRAGIHDATYEGAGAHPAMGYGPSPRRPVSPGEPFVVDAIGNYEGYHNDNTRTFVFGKASGKTRQYYADLVEIVHYILDMMQPGAVTGEIYTNALKKVRQMGYEDNFMGLGQGKVKWICHGVGMEGSEFPLVAQNAEIRLEENMVMSVEPKLYFEDIGGVGFEGTFHITGNGPVLLSATPYDAIVEL